MSTQWWQNHVSHKEGTVWKLPSSPTTILDLAVPRYNKLRAGTIQGGHNEDQRVVGKHPLRKPGLQREAPRLWDREKTPTNLILRQIRGVTCQPIQNIAYCAFSFTYISWMGLNEPWIILQILILKINIICMIKRFLPHKLDQPRESYVCASPRGQWWQKDLTPVYS